MRFRQISLSAVLASCLFSCLAASSGSEPGAPKSDASVKIPDAEPSSAAMTATPDPLESAHVLVWGWATGAFENEDDGAGDEEMVGVTFQEIGETYALDASGEVTATAAGAIVRSHGELFSFEVRQHEVDRAPCYPDTMISEIADPAIAATLREQAAVEANELSERPTALVDEASFVNLRTGVRRVVASFDVSEGAQDFAFTTRLVGTVGDHAFLRSDSYLYTCGAHGSTSASQSVFDIARGSETALAVPETAMKAALHDADVALVPADEFDSRFDSSIELVEWLPQYDTTARLSMNARFATSTCYACTRGNWSAYMAAARVAVPALPSSLSPHATPPAVVSAFAKAHPSFRIGGYSVR